MCNTDSMRSNRRPSRLFPHLPHAGSLCSCLPLLLILFALSSCKQKKEDEKMPSALGITQQTKMGDDYDLPDIQQAGELIVLTLYGPDTYYEYHDVGLGLQYELAEMFAQSLGVQLRVETARDTTELYNRLQADDADIVALELPVTPEVAKKFTFCGAFTNHQKNDSIRYTRTQWLVRKGSPLLAKAADNWYKADLKHQVELADLRRFQPARRTHYYAPILDLKSGVISRYDALFIRHGQRIGWDWRLLAAQCYQESGFDADAVSWAGARGLMQIMPGTAATLGLAMDKVHEPNSNIEAATRYLALLSARFIDVRDPGERTSFVLGAYNGGYNHMRDAMALARKYGKNPNSWADVSQYVLHLREAHFYNDPVVRYGYMRGNETYEYVLAIRSRYDQYRSKIRGPRTTQPTITIPTPHPRIHKSK
jgi:membrane-bound lytic murein transglycosylase F